MNIVRMWINQPSVNQPYHALHGVKVLAACDRLSRDFRPVDEVTNVFFLSGPVVSQVILSLALSPGWPI